MLRILGARWPMAQVWVVPVRVQGEGAAEEIAAAIRWTNWQQAADLIITGRGGGSMEDLWAFNEEVVARAIFDSEIPVISAVGHEPDVTIADFVADLRAATPSNAAELAVPDQNEIWAVLLHDQKRLEHGMARQLARCRQNLERLSRSRMMTDPAAYVRDKRLLLDYQEQRLVHGAERNLTQQKARLARLAAALDAMSPLKVLGRGYAIAQREDGRMLCSVQDIEPGGPFSLRLADGTLRCRVEDETTDTETLPGSPL
jgi:exodeoxyribonuclease VII large subunit